MKISYCFLHLLFFGLPAICFAQADNEIQVYSSPITPKAVTFVELHQNYTFQGPLYLADKNAAHWVNETLEITRGLGSNLNWAFTHSPGFRPMVNMNFWVIISAPDLLCLPLGVGTVA